jgi:hypothetical protein
MHALKLRGRRQEIRTLRAMWRALETEPRQILNGHEEGNLGNKPRTSLRAAAPALDPTRILRDLLLCLVRRSLHDKARRRQGCPR